MFLIQGINVLTGIGLAILLARMLGLEGYGVYIFALALVHILGMPAQMGLPTLIMRQVAVYRAQQDWSQLRAIIVWAVGFIAVTSLAIAIVALGYMLLVDNLVWSNLETRGLYVAALVLVFVLALMSLSRAVLAGFERIITAAMPDSVIRPVLLLTSVLCIGFFVELSPSVAMMLHAAAALCALMWAVLAIGKLEISASCADVGFKTKDWLKSLWPLTLISGAAMINSRLDIAMLGALSDTRSVGIYDIGLRFAGLLMLAQSILNGIVAPKVARLNAQGARAELQDMLVVACRISFTAAVVGLIAIWLAGGPVIQILFGPEFTPSLRVAFIASIGYVFNTGAGAVAVLLNMTGNEGTTAKIILVSAILNTILNLILIPLYAAVGAAAATSITVVLVQSLLWHRAKTLTGLRGDILAPWSNGKVRSSPSHL